MFRSSDQNSISKPTEAQLGWVVNNRDVIGLIARGEYLPQLQDACSWAQTSRFFYHATDNILMTRKHALLSDHILVQPNLVNLKKVIAIMESDPLSLEYKIKCAYDNRGRVFENKTLFQLACAAGDIEFCRELKSVFIKHLPSEFEAVKAMIRQRDEMIGNKDDFTAQAEEKLTHIDLLITNVIAEISKQDFTSSEKGIIVLSATTLEKIGDLKAVLNQILMTPNNGAYYSCIVLLNAFEIYSNTARDWEYNVHKCLLFEDAVFAPILSYLPANDTHNFSTGLLHYDVDGSFEEIISTMRGHPDKLSDIVRGPSLNFMISGAYFNILSGCISDIAGVFPLDEKIQERCALVREYVDYKLDEFDMLLSVPDNDLEPQRPSLGEMNLGAS